MWSLQAVRARVSFPPVPFPARPFLLAGPPVAKVTHASPEESPQNVHWKSS
jgi:hypothetical protein